VTVTVPAKRPVTTPEVEPMIAEPVEVQLQVPPEVESVTRAVNPPSQVANVPVIIAGNGSIVSVEVIMQVVASV
jgi:hypothetical protein